MEAHPPVESSRRILLCVSGLSPQIVTETLYALAASPQCQQRFVPDEIHLITTREGAERARLSLLSDHPGWFHRLRADYRLPPIRFDDSTIHVLCDADGQPLGDIRSAEDNTRAADQIADIVRTLTGDAGSALHASIAGGRKTMGYYLGYALSLWGREQDRLSHVLVDAPYESSWSFFYPTPHESVIETRPGGPLVDARLAHVTLAEIPFVRLRHGLPQSLLAGTARFADAVQAAQRTLGPPRLTIAIDPVRITAAGKALLLEPADAAFLLWFARRARQHLPGLTRPADGAPDGGYAKGYLAAYDCIKGCTAQIDKRYRNGMSTADFDERKSRVNKVLNAALGRAAAPYLIIGQGSRPQRFGLLLDADAISLGDGAEAPSTTSL